MIAEREAQMKALAAKHQLQCDRQQDLEQDLQLKGDVRYCMPVYGQQRGYRVGVHFKTFGYSWGCNPMEALEALRLLHDTYAR